MRYKRMLNSKKAISPIFATLILIAIAVIAGVVVYMFTSGVLSTMTAGGVAGTEKITVQAASISVSGNTVVYVEQTAGPAATINSLLIKNTSGATVTELTADTALTLGQLTTITVSTGSGTGGSSAVSVGSVYTVTLTTKAGGSFVSPSVNAQT